MKLQRTLMSMAVAGLMSSLALAQTLRQRALDENALVLLVGQTLPADLPAGLPLTAQSLVPDLPTGVPSELLTRRPDVRQPSPRLLEVRRREAPPLGRGPAPASAHTSRAPSQLRARRVPWLFLRRETLATEYVVLIP